MTSTSVIEISESALKNNIYFLKETLGASCQLSAVIKGNAYGHGISTYAPIAEKCGVNHFSVFSADEAFKAKEVLNDSRLMIMGFIDQADLRWVVEHNISFFVFERGRLEAAIEAAKSLQNPARIHIEFDTGMNRTGFTKKELKPIIDILKENKEHLVVEGFCTHYAGAESIANDVRVRHQIKAYKQFDGWMGKQRIIPETRHTACSAAAMNYPKTRMDMARIGIMQYGYWPNRETFINYLSGKTDKTDPLKRVITWKSKVMTTHIVKPGEFIGYGTSYMVESLSKIAVVPVGYAHGYSRSLSNQGRVLINGQRVGIMGMVNMNMLIVDVTNIPDTTIGDEVVLIGKQGDLEISVSSFGELSIQLNYELLTRLPQDIPRIITA
ncbi:MAG: alanine racemase [Bacteroidia bacterium]|jgi:alanine racemase